MTFKLIRYQAVTSQTRGSVDYQSTDSCHGRVMRKQQNLYSLVPPTAVVKLLQHSGLGSNTGMGFHPMNDVHQCLENGEAFVWIFGFLFKTVGVVWLLTNCKG